MAETSKPKTTAPKAKKAAPKRKTATKPAAGTKPKAAPRVAAKKQAPAAKPRKPAARPAAATSTGFDVTKLIDHPLVADLLTVGAMAAVAAIADHNVKTRTGEAQSGSSKVVKAAGKAAAAAVGKRLMTEVDQLRQAAKPKS